MNDMSQMQPMQPGGMSGQPTNPLIAELDNRLRNLSPQELQQLDMELSRANPAFLQIIGKIFPELQQALMVLGQMGQQQGGGQMPMNQNANPLSSDVSSGLMGGGY